MTEYQQYIVDTYEWARKAGLVSKKQEFAEKIGTNYTALTSLMKGSARFVGTRTYEKVKRWRKQIENSTAETQKKKCDKDFNWAEFRIETAKMFAAIMIKEGTVKGLWPDPEEISFNAVNYVDRLIEELKK